ncbi:replication initiator [Brachybacterium alimentarium]|uniref:replication initiator n=1 Tax=Brachybacterium alimentarium TaxID=47845 RepID=UPI003FD3FB99
MEHGEKVGLLTIAAPSFGPTHYVPPTPPPRHNSRLRAAWDKRNRRRCRCGQHHAPGDRRWIGLPTHVDAYDDDAQVRWNAVAGRPWSRTVDELARILDVRDIDDKLLRMPYVAEWRSREAR